MGPAEWFLVAGLAAIFCAALDEVVARAIGAVREVREYMRTGRWPK